MSGIGNRAGARHRLLLNPHINPRMEHAMFEALINAIIGMAALGGIAAAIEAGVIAYENRDRK